MLLGKQKQFALTSFRIIFHRAYIVQAKTWRMSILIQSEENNSLGDCFRKNDPTLKVNVEGKVVKSLTLLEKVCVQRGHKSFH